MTDLPTPITPSDCDLRDFAFLPLDVVRLRDSDLAIHVTGEEFRCAVLLWCASWHQVPAASLPDDDRTLAALAGFGRAVSEWEKHKTGALRGWIKCSDGRLYHPVVAEKANEAWASKHEYAHRKLLDRLRKSGFKKEDMPTLDDWLSAGKPKSWTINSNGTEGNSNGKNENSNGNDKDSNGIEDQSAGNDGNSNDPPSGNPVEKSLKGQGEGQGYIKDNPLPPAGVDGWQKPDWVPADLWKEFEALRKKRKKPMTDRARSLAVAKLQALQDGGHDVKAVMEQSILHAWDTFYPLKTDSVAAGTEAWSTAI